MTDTRRRYLEAKGKLISMSQHALPSGKIACVFLWEKDNSTVFMDSWGDAMRWIAGFLSWEVES